MKKLSIVGKSLPRKNARELVTGHARYISNTVRPGMLVGKILRSPHAHARIKSIDVSRAERIPGVKAVITAEDTPQIKYAFQFKYAVKLPLEAEKVRCVGDEVAAVAAVDERTAEKAIQAIEVEYEVLPAVFDVREAIKPDAPQLHQEYENNVVAHVSREFGDVDKAFEESDYVFEDHFETQSIAHCCMETRNAVAEYDQNGKLTIWACTQIPHVLRRILAHVLDMPLGKIRVIKTYLGGGFGSRQSIDPINPICAFLAKKAGKPVKIVKNREEEFSTDRIRAPMILNLKTGVSKDGRIKVRELQVISNAGAYNDQVVAVTSSAASKASSLYRVDSVKFEGIVVATNKSWGGAFRGYGNPQGTFAIESQMDRIAEELGIDPVELRLRNANQKGDVTVGGAKLVSCEFEECIRQAAAAVDWKINEQSQGSVRRGVGMACLIHTGGGGPSAHGTNFSTAFIKIKGDGTVDIFTGVPDIGQGSDTVLAQIAAEELGVSYEAINVISADTEITPATIGVRGSRETFMAGNAVKLAASQAKEKLLQRAAEVLEIDAEELEIQGGLVYPRQNPDQSVAIAEIIIASEPEFTSAFPMSLPIVASSSFVDTFSTKVDPKTGKGNACPTWAFGAQVAEVEVDIETGQVKVLNVVSAHDVGRAINPVSVEGQIEGSVAQGIGFALTEELLWQDGKMVNPDFTDYKMPTPLDMPPIKSILVEEDDPYGPFGAKGVGEAPLVPTAPAIANAIYNATGARVKQLPITPERLLQALEEVGATES